MPQPIGSAVRIPSPTLDAHPTPAQAPPPQSDPYARLYAAQARQPDVSRMLIVRPHAHTAIAPLAPAVRSETATKLDALEAAFAGPYRVPGHASPVSAQPTFHSNHAANAQLKASPAQNAFAMRACRTPELTRALDACRVARPTAQQLVAVTQALIDAGALRGGSAQDIRNLQAQFCIGIDCIGFVRQLEVGLHGATPFANDSVNAGCTAQMRAAKKFLERPLAAIVDARPGDVVHLAPSKDTENRQHNLVVRSNEMLSPTDPRRTTLLAKGAGDLAKGGPLHLLEVVCSGGGDDAIRGVRREVWVYNASTKAWGTTDPRTGAITVSPRGPEGHDAGSVFVAQRRLP